MLCDATLTFWLEEDSPTICWRSARTAIAQASPPDGDDDDGVDGSTLWSFSEISSGDVLFWIPGSWSERKELGLSYSEKCYILKSLQIEQITCIESHIASMTIISSRSKSNWPSLKNFPDNHIISHLIWTTQIQSLTRFTVLHINLARKGMIWKYNTITD